MALASGRVDIESLARDSQLLLRAMQANEGADVNDMVSLSASYARLYSRFKDFDRQLQFQEDRSKNDIERMESIETELTAAASYNDGGIRPTCPPRTCTPRSGIMTTQAQTHSHLHEVQWPVRSRRRGKVKLDMDVTVASLGGQLCQFSAISTDRICDVKASIFCETAIPVDLQCVLCSAVEPNDFETLGALLPGRHVAHLSLLRRVPAEEISKSLENLNEIQDKRAAIRKLEAALQESYLFLAFHPETLRHEEVAEAIRKGAEAEADAERSWQALRVELAERRRATKRSGTTPAQHGPCLKQPQGGHCGLGCRKR